jgi:ankyrin repeat protein
MSAPTHPLDQVTIPKPCNADWDSMIGNDKVRFCEHCNLHVNNLSAMTRTQAMRLVARSRGRLCVRFIQLPGVKVLTKTPEKLYRIGGRVSRIAAGAFTATLSLSSGAAQTRSDPAPGMLRQTQTTAALSINPAAEGRRLSGIIKDPNGAVVSGATVTLSNMQTNLAFVYTTGDDGTYTFSLLEGGRYRVMAEAPSFAPTGSVEIDLQANAARTVDFALKIPEVIAQVEVMSEIVTMGVMSVNEPAHRLIRAAFRNNLAEVAQLAPITSDLNANDEATDTSALAYAVQNHNRDMVLVLLAAGANPNSVDSHGNTPLMHLHEGATVELVHTLISAGAGVNAQDDAGETALLLAAGSCNFAVFKELIDAGARIDAMDNNRNTVLINAAANDDVEVLKLMIKAGLNVNAKNHAGKTALANAAESGKGEALKALIEAGAEMSLTPQELNQALEVAIRNEDLDSVRTFIAAGADVNVKSDANDTTLLMQASEKAKPEVLKVLIHAGADLNSVDDGGWTAIMHADEVENVRLLINAGADMTIRTKDGLTALGMALKYEQPEIVALLKSLGAPE